MKSKHKHMQIIITLLIVDRCHFLQTLGVIATSPHACASATAMAGDGSDNEFVLEDECFGAVASAGRSSAPASPCGRRSRGQREGQGQRQREGPRQRGEQRGGGQGRRFAPEEEVRLRVHGLP